MITKEQWADKALHVARFGTSASSGEHAAWEGLPLLRKALNALSALDRNHRQGVVDIVTDWKEGQHSTFLKSYKQCTQRTLRKLNERR